MKLEDDIMKLKNIFIVMLLVCVSLTGCQSLATNKTQTTGGKTQAQIDYDNKQKEYYAIFEGVWLCENGDYIRIYNNGGYEIEYSFEGETEIKTHVYFREGVNSVYINYLLSGDAAGSMEVILAEDGISFEYNGNVFEKTDEEDLKRKMMENYDSYIESLINPDYPYGDTAFSEFIYNISIRVPAKYARYERTIEGDPMIFYYDYIVDGVIGDYIIEGYDSTYDKWSADPGISYYNYPYIFNGKDGNIYIGECINEEAYKSVFNYDNSDTSYVYCNYIGKGELESDWIIKDEIPVKRINEAATITIGLNTVNNPNTITVDDNGIVIDVILNDVDDYLAKGVYFKDNNEFSVVFENISNPEDRVERTFSINEGVVAENK